MHLNDDPVCGILQVSSVSCTFAVRLVSFSSLPGWDVCCDLLDDIVAFECVVGADARVDLELRGGRRREGKISLKVIKDSESRLIDDSRYLAHRQERIEDRSGGRDSQGP